jgi:catechol 2,3-dioxygenase-like lactoylglutathione lyase family enzyme
MVSDDVRRPATDRTMLAATSVSDRAGLATLFGVITSTHAIIYAEDAERARAFFRDVLELPHVDAHDGWLIFRLPPAELGIHPTEAGPNSGRHELFLMCDDIHRTVDELRSKGVEFATPVEDQGFGLVTTLRVPGGGSLGLYQPKHATAYER